MDSENTIENSSNNEPVTDIDDMSGLICMENTFVSSYIAHRDECSVNDWLLSELAAQMPKKSKDEIQTICNDIIGGISQQQTTKDSLDDAINNGRSKESWFASKMVEATSAMSAQMAGAYLTNLDTAISEANTHLYNFVMTSAGTVNQNPNLHGLLAEELHTLTFNLNAEARGSQYRAYALQSNTKNSVDTVVRDARTMKIDSKYQLKYGPDGNSTNSYFNHGNYRGQQKVVPAGQEDLIGRKSTPVMRAPDGTTSNPLSYDRAKDIQNRLQNGAFDGLDWNEYSLKDLATGIGRNAGGAALLGVIVGAGAYAVQKSLAGEKIDGGELLGESLKTGSDFGIKAALAGAIKVASERGLLALIPKGTPMGIITAIAFVAVEDAKVLISTADGELGLREGVDKLEQVTVSCIAGLSVASVGANVGASVLACAGPIGVFIGFLVGGSIGYMVGSKVGEMETKKVQKLRDHLYSALSNVIEQHGDFAFAAASNIRAFCGTILDFA